MKENRVEQVKNVVLVVLLISTILLLSFFWGKVSLDQLVMQEKPIVQDVPQLEQIIRPNLMVLNFGAGNYTLLTTENSDLWQSPERSDMVEEFRRFSDTAGVEVKEILPEKYKEIRNSWVSIWAQFEYNVPFNGFCREFNIKWHPSYEVIESFTIMGYSSEAKPETIIFYDQKNNKYYGLTAGADSAPTNFGQLIERAKEEGYTSYYPIGAYFGPENDILIPVEAQANLNTFTYEQEIHPMQTEKVRALAGTFFGENLDFVRTIVEESGALIYMYGFGQNVFIVNPDGSFTYKEEQIKNNTPSGFFDSLRKALDFVAYHGSWESLEGWKAKPFLKGVVSNPEEKKGYRFIFGMEINGIPLYDQTGEVITVDVLQGQVTFYQRSFVHVNQTEFNEPSKGSIENQDKEESTIVNLIVQNYQYMHETWQNAKGKEEQKDEEFNIEWVAKQITGVQPGYLRVPGEGITGELRPVWVVTMDGIRFYFDDQTGEPLGYS